MGVSVACGNGMVSNILRCLLAAGAVYAGLKLRDNNQLLWCSRAGRETGEMDEKRLSSSIEGYLVVLKVS